eukprot:s5239_g8.t1
MQAPQMQLANTSKPDATGAIRIQRCQSASAFGPPARASRFQKFRRSWRSNPWHRYELCRLVSEKQGQWEKGDALGHATLTMFVRCRAGNKKYRHVGSVLGSFSARAVAMTPSGRPAFSSHGRRAAPARLAVLAILGAAFCGSRLQKQARPVPVRRASADTDGDSASFEEGDLVRVESDAIEEVAVALVGSRWITSEDSELLQVPSEDLRRCPAEPCEDLDGGEGGWRLLSPET